MAVRFPWASYVKLVRLPRGSVVLVTWLKVAGLSQIPSLRVLKRLIKFGDVEACL